MLSVDGFIFNYTLLRYYRIREGEFVGGLNYQILVISLQ